MYTLCTDLLCFKFEYGLVQDKFFVEFCNNLFDESFRIFPSL